MFRIHYALSLVLLITLYAFQLNETGYRLPVYYMPDGVIVSVQSAEPAPRIRRLIEVEGRAPQSANAFFETNKPVPVLTDKGPALMRPVPVDRLQQLLDFSPVIVLSALYLLAGIWFIQYGNDFYLASFCLLTCTFLFAFVAAIAGHGLDLLWQITGFLIIPALFNLGLRTTGKEVSGTLILAEALVVLFFCLVAFVGSEDLRTFSNLFRVQHLGYYATVLAVLGFQLENALRTSHDRIEKTKRWFLFCGSVFGLVLPVAALDLRRGAGIESFYLSGITAAVLPVSLVYGTYRIHVVPFQFVLGRSIMAGMLTLFFVAIYGAVLLTHSILLPDQDEQYRWIVHLVFLLTLVFFLDPARRRISTFIEKSLWRLDGDRAESLKRIAGIFSEATRIDHAAEAFLAEIKQTLKIEKAAMLISDRSFAGFKLKGDLLVRLADQSPVWGHIHPEKMAVASYLTFAGGSRGLLYRYLIDQNFAMAVGVSGQESDWLTQLRRFMMRKLGRKFIEKRAPLVALMIGFKPDNVSFSLSEIRYIQESGRLARMLVTNFGILLEEVAKRRQMREIVLAGQTQRNVADDWRLSEVKDISLGAFSLPVLSVTGDYLDLIHLPHNRIAFFLGDVSGHGLGTGYLVSAIRSMVRSHMLSGIGLAETVGTLNSFLMERYRGNEFITLFAFILDLGRGQVEYLNAAHPGPMIFRFASGGIETLRDTQRLPGLLLDPYRTAMFSLQKGDRLFLYSDGVTETFNPRAEPYGEARLRGFLYQHLGLTTKEIASLLKKDLSEFRQSPHPEDDTTFVAFEYNPRPRGLLSFLNIDET